MNNEEDGREMMMIIVILRAGFVDEKWIVWWKFMAISKGFWGVGWV